MSVKARGAVVHGQGQDWSVEDLDLRGPGPGEVLVRVVASGLCHSDEHLRSGRMPQPLPLVGGHEGAGIVEAVGEAVTRVRPGDHVCTAYIPGCGTCAWCARGMQYVCDNGADMASGMMLDGTARFHTSAGLGIGAMQRLGTFANWLVTSEMQCIRIDDDIPFESAALLSCGVSTGWGSAVYAGGATPNDVVAVMGLGGVGMGAVQGARQVGSRAVIAIDPVEFKREAALRLGATAAFADIDLARPHIQELTNGQGADVVVITVGQVEGEHIASAVSATRKAGTTVLTSVGRPEPGIPISPVEMCAWAKTLKGAVFGNCNPTRDIPRFLRSYKAGQLRLDELVTRTYSVEDINAACADLHAGRLIRAVITHEH